MYRKSPNRSRAACLSQAYFFLGKNLFDKQVFIFNPPSSTSCRLKVNIHVDEADAVFHIHVQATQTFHLESIFRIEAMAYKPSLQAALEYKPHGLLPGTYGT